MPQLLLFGLNPISLQTATFAAQQGFDCTVIADARQQENWRDAATQSGLKVISTEKPADLPLEEWLKQTDRTLAISIGAPWFFEQKWLERFSGSTLLNLHGTHLPRSRGGNLFSWQILSGQRSGVCLLHQLTATLDAGPVVDFEEFIYPAQCRKPADYIDWYETKNVAFLKQFLAKWVRNEVGTPAGAQAEYLSTYWPRLRADLNGWVDWNWPLLELERFVCAFDEPYGGARCRWRGKEIILREAWAQSQDGHTHPFQWGIVTRNNGKWLNVAVQGGELLICSVGDLKGTDLLPSVRPGDRLYSNPSDLEKARQRVIKTPKGLEIQPLKP